MGYNKQNFTDGQTLTHTHLNNIEDGIVALEKSISSNATTTSNYWGGKKMVWNGDSISYGSWLSNPSKTAYPILVGNALGMTTYNYAIGGSYAAKPEGSFDKYYWDYNQWTNDVNSGVVDTNKKYLVKDNPGAAKPCKIYYYNGTKWTTNSDSGGWAIVERMKEMVALHPDADVIGIAIGTNDFYTAKCPFGTIDGANYRNLQILRDSLESETEKIEQVSTINLVDDLIVIAENVKLSENNGELIQSVGNSVAQMIPVIAGKKYYTTNSTYVWYYDSQESPISGVNPLNSNSYITIPENVSYISMNFLSSEIADESAGLYEILLVNKPKGVDLLETDNENIIFTDNVKLSSATYELVADDTNTYYVYEYIPITPGKEYSCSYGLRTWFLDADKNSLSTVNLKNQEYKFTAPKNAYYVSINFSRNSAGEPSDAYLICLDDIEMSEEEEILTKSTFCGAMHTICKYLCENYKNKDIFFITPIKRYQPGTWDCKYPEDKNSLGLTLKDYSDAIMEICSYYSIPVIDFYSISGLNPHIDTSLFGDTDGKAVHPNLEGHKRMASLVVAYLQSLRK